MSRLAEILDTLEAFHGPQTANAPSDPYQFLVWWHCGYPASEERCSRGWKSLNEAVGISPEKLLATPPSKLARALRAGGMIPELRAGRLKEIAKRVQEEFGGDLRSGLSRLPLAQARAVLKKFPGIADPGADRILLFGEIATSAAVPSSCPQVLVRIEIGRPHETYNANYRDAQEIMQNQVADRFAARTRAYLLVLRHGQDVCKRSGRRPKLLRNGTSKAPGTSVMGWQPRSGKRFYRARIMERSRKGSSQCGADCNRSMWSNPSRNEPAAAVTPGSAWAAEAAAP